MSGAEPATPAELGQRVAAIAEQLRQVAAAADADSPAVARQLVPLAAQITAAVAAAVNTAEDPLGTGRSNLQTLQALGRRLTAAADNALNQQDRQQDRQQQAGENDR